MNKCKIYYSNYNCPWNSCFETFDSDGCSENVSYEVCSCARYVDVPMKIVNLGGMTEGEFQSDAIDLLESIAQSLCGISDTLEDCCGGAERGCGCGCNGFNSYDTSNTPCGYSNVSGNYGCRGCCNGRCR